MKYKLMTCLLQHNVCSVKHYQFAAIPNLFCLKYYTFILDCLDSHVTFCYFLAHLTIDNNKYLYSFNYSYVKEGEIFRWRKINIAQSKQIFDHINCIKILHLCQTILHLLSILHARDILHKMRRMLRRQLIVWPDTRIYICFFHLFRRTKFKRAWYCCREMSLAFSLTHM